MIKKVLHIRYVQTTESCEYLHESKFDDVCFDLSLHRNKAIKCFDEIREAFFAGRINHISIFTTQSPIPEMTDLFDCYEKDLEHKLPKDVF